MSESKDPNIAALLRELRGLRAVRQEGPRRQVRADLKRRGYKDEKSEEPKKRVSREAKQATADDSAKKRG
jgi:hypothetical protein